MIIQIQSEEVRQAITTLQFRGCRIYLDRNNVKESACKDCRVALRAGEGVFRNSYREIGYLCFKCLRADLLTRTRDFGFEDGDAGFHFVDDGGTLAQCFTGYPPRQFTSDQVLGYIRAEWKYEIAERTLGGDVPSTRVYDVSESVQL